MKKIILCLLLFFPSTLFAEIYLWSDGDNTVHFSDTPENDAKPVHLSTLSSYSSHAVSKKQTHRVSMISTDPAYSDISILSPANQATIVNNEQGDLRVDIELEPSLNKGDAIRLLMDGRVVSTEKSLSFKLNNIDRGEHTLQAQVMSQQGVVLISSATVTFYMQRPRINSHAEKKGC